MRLAPAFAGMFYPTGPELEAWVDEALDHSPRQAPVAGRTVGALVPHAGYVYSGETAAMALGAARECDIDRIVVLGPSHRTPVDGLHAFEVEGFETPLGPVESDPAWAARLVHRLTGASCGAPFAEHSLEVQLPLLRRLFPDVPVVLVAFGLPDPTLAGELSRRLARDPGRLLVVASSDLSHYHACSSAAILDGRFREVLLDGDPEKMWRALRARQVEACGAGPVLTLMSLACETKARFYVMDQRDSSHAFGDTDQVVGYLSALAIVEEPAFA